MCGRFAVDKKPEEIAEEVQALWDDEVLGLPSWNTCPTAFTPVLSQGKLHSWSWGLIPGWAKDDTRRAGLINARIESLDEKPAFKSLLGHRQCIIPIDGYYEWLQKGETKIPYYFQNEDNSMLLLGGLWDKWINKTGQEVTSFTVITKEAAENISELHHRMPVILDLQNAHKWAQNALKREELISLSQNRLKFHEVSRDVNSVRNNSPELIKATDKPQFWQDELF